MSSQKVSNGIGFAGLLTILFIGLKLTNCINWNWWLVLLPLYWWLIPVAFFLIVSIIIAVLGDKK